MSEIDAPDAKPEGKGKSWAVAALVVAVVVLCGWAINRNASKPDPGAEPRDAKRVCQEEFVPKRLKAPKTAEFSGVTVEESGGTYTVTGSVDAQNSFGALIRSSFTCVVHSSGDNWVLDSATVS